MSTYKIYGISNYNQSAYQSGVGSRYDVQSNYTLVGSGSGSVDSTFNIAGYSGFAIFIDNNMAINKLLLGTTPLATDQNTVLIGGNLDMTPVERGGYFFEDIFRAKDGLSLQDNNMQSGGTMIGGVIVGGVETGATLIFTTRSARTLSVAIDDLSRTGTAGADRLVGDARTNYMSGLAGNDALDGGAGVDTMVGGLGNDAYQVRNVGDLVTEAANGGTDTVFSYLGSYALTANVENGRVMTTTGTGNLSGNGLSNVLYAGKGANVLNGGSGFDTVSYQSGQAGTTGVSVSLATTLAQATGGSGSDTLVSIEHLVGSAYADNLTGSAVANALNGGAGNDRLTGGLGQDRLTGGAGNDIFDFNAVGESGLTSTTRDIVNDFVSGQDRIDLSTIDANTATSINNAFTQLIASTATFSAAGQLRFFGGVLYGNTDADSAAEFAIQLTGVSAVSSADFVF